MKRIFTTRSTRFALWVVLGLGLLALPMTEVWRRHGQELQAAMDARRALQPVALAAQAQRALVSHRPYAAAVLSGRLEQEAERLRRQHAVDGEVAGLVATLELHRLHRALAEADQLREEWSALLEGIGRRNLSTAASDTAHDLLVEQTFVIVDLIGGTSGLQGQAGRAFDGAELSLALHTLPRFGAALGAWSAQNAATAAAANHSPAAAQRLRTQARQVATAAAEILAAIDADAERAPPPAFVKSLVALRHAAEGLSQSAGTPPDAAKAHRALFAASAACEALLTRLDAGLVESMATLRLERLFVGVAGAVLLLLGALAASLALPRLAARASASLDTGHEADADHVEPLDTSAGQLGGENEGPASDLMQRLRRGEGDAVSRDAPDAPDAPSAHQGVQR